MEKIKDADLTDRIKSESQNLGERASRMQRRFSQEFQEGMKEFREEMEKQKQKR